MSIRSLFGLATVAQALLALSYVEAGKPTAMLEGLTPRDRRYVLALADYISR